MPAPVARAIVKCEASYGMSRDCHSWYNYLQQQAYCQERKWNVVSQRSIDVARKAQVVYEEQLRAKLEATNVDDFVAIEPESGDYFLGKTLSEAIQAARAAYPDRLPFALRVGHRSTVEMGVMVP